MKREISIDDQYPHVGLSAYLERAVWFDPARAERIANLLVDKRWPWIPWWLSLSGKHRRSDRPSVRVGGKNGSQPIVNSLLSRIFMTLYMNRARGDGNFTSVALDLDDYREQWSEPYKISITCRSAELPAGKSFDEWLTLMHELLVALGALTGTIGAWPSYTWAKCDTWLSSIVLDTPRGDINLGLPPEFNAQISLANHWYKKMGRTYARHPRWGTYLHEGHVAAIGGVERIRAEVEPAVIKAVGALTYIQLTASIETGMSAEAEEKRKKLEALMAPIIVGAPLPAEATT